MQLRVLRGELGRQHDENKKLRSLLDQITKNYKDLQAQLLVAMQKQTQGCRVQQVIHSLSCLTDQLPLHYSIYVCLVLVGDRWIFIHPYQSYEFLE